MKITLRGNDLLSPATFTPLNGDEPYEDRVPSQALPNCNICPKPELGPINAQVVRVFNTIHMQRYVGPMDGAWGPLRFEAVKAAIEWYLEAGQISDPDEVMERIWILDRAAIDAHNASLDSKREAPPGAE